MASINGRLPILASIDGIMYGEYPDGSFVPPPTPEEIATEAVVLSEYTTRQSDIDTAQGLVTALDPSAERDALQLRIDNIVVIPRLIEANTISPLVQTPYISRQGLRVRAPGIIADFKLEDTINQGDGWAVVHCEGKSLTSFRTLWGIGDEASILAAPDQGNGNDQCILCGQRPYYDGAIVAPRNTDFVIAVNYETNPHVYIIDVAANSVVFDQVLPITTPVSFVTKTIINTDAEREWYYNLNTCSDTNNRPFPVDVDTLLTNAGADTEGLVLGWGVEQARPVPAGSTAITITTTPPVSPSIGTPITLNATCIDADGNDRATDIRWYNDFINWNNVDEAFTDGDELTFTPDELGSYQVRATYEDTYGNFHEDSITILVDGTVTHTDDTQFDVTRSHPSIASLGTTDIRFEIDVPFKLVGCTNNTNWGKFRYFEVTCDAPDGQFGVGVTSLLNTTPLADDPVMWSGRISGDAPQEGAGAFSMLTFAQGVTLQQQWVNGDNQTPTGNSFFLDTSNTTFGFSGGTLGVVVDNRIKENPPTVYIIDANTSSPSVSRVSRVFSLWNCRTPVAPMVYCNTASSLVGAGTDLSINGGNNGAFIYDAESALNALGIDTTTPVRGEVFENGWTTSEIQP